MLYNIARVNQSASIQCNAMMIDQSISTKQFYPEIETDVYAASKAAQRQVEKQLIRTQFCCVWSRLKRGE